MTQADSELQAKEPSARPIERLLGAFGGAQALARRLGLPAATVEEWRAKGSVPRERRAAILAAAEREGIALDPGLLAESLRAAPTIDAGPAGAAETTPSASPPAKPRWLGRLPPQLPVLVFGGLLVIAGFLLAMGTSSLWLGPPTDWADRVEELEEHTQPALEKLDKGVAALERLERQVATLRQQVADQPAGVDPAALDGLRTEMLAELDRRLAAQPAADLSGLEDRLAQLSERLDQLARQQGELQQALASLQAAVAERAQAKTTPAADVAALAAATAALAERVRAGQGYVAELAVVRQLALAKPELAEPLGVLGFNAAEGIATLDALRADLAARAPAILLAARDAEGGNALDELAADLSLLLGGRPVGEAAGDSADARLARAELRLEEGDLAAALAELKALQGPAATAAQPWVARAEARIATLAAVDRVQQLASSWLAGE